MTLTASAEGHPSMARKARHGQPGEVKPFFEGRVGGSYSIARKKWMQRDQLDDREKNHYHQRVTDPETGELIHECDEALDQHRGHGSGKRCP